MPLPIHNRPELREAAFESLLADVFRRAGWNVVRQSRLRDNEPDLVVDSAGKKYVVELKRSAEGRRDRLVALLSQAILEAQVAARKFSRSAVPVAVVASRHIPDSVAEQVKQFGIHHAPDVAIGILDSEGFRAFHGFGLEKLNSERVASSGAGLSLQSQSPSYLFSDLNQWMLKILLAANIPESLLSAPRQRYKSASQLAKAAGVSVMSASRLVRQLLNEGFLDNRNGWLHLVRIEELMQKWLGASQRGAREIPMRWIIRGGKDQLLSAVQSYVSRMDARKSRPRRPREDRLLGPAPRICVGLFAAADLLGFGFVHGVPSHLYLERPAPDTLKQLGLSVEGVERHPDVYVRIPENKEAVFRPVVRHGGIPVCDILQVWLDVSNHPARGKEQAEQIWKRVLAPSIEKKER